VRCRRSRLWFVEKGKVELRMCEKLEALQLRTVALMRTFRVSSRLYYGHLAKVGACTFTDICETLF
jgi:hypothetical protein